MIITEHNKIKYNKIKKITLKLDKANKQKERSPQEDIVIYSRYPLIGSNYGDCSFNYNLQRIAMYPNPFPTVSVILLTIIFGICPSKY